MYCATTGYVSYPMGCYLVLCNVMLFCAILPNIPVCYYLSLHHYLLHDMLSSAQTLVCIKQHCVVLHFITVFISGCFIVWHIANSNHIF